MAGQAHSLGGLLVGDQGVLTFLLLNPVSYHLEASVVAELLRLPP